MIVTGQLFELTKEIEMLYTKTLKNPNYNRIRDYYVFLCLTGIRFGDFVSINENNFAIKKDGTVTFSLFTQKTRIKIEFPLPKQAKEIAERYNYRFDYYTNQAFNRTLKELFKNEGLFDDDVIVYRETLNHKPQPIKIKEVGETYCSFGKTLLYINTDRKWC